MSQRTTAKTCLVKEVSIEFGGGTRWYCVKCGTIKGDNKKEDSPNGTNCGHISRELDEKKHRVAFLERYGREFDEDDFDLNIGSELLEDDDLYTKLVCESTKYVWEYRKPTVVDKISNDYLSLWAELAVAKDRGSNPGTDLRAN